ncbi:MAG: 2-succinyl-5-enolpyruvyl-6-hydroxy-3-cyclohexene-1-carboxylic-acid synthase [Balneolales bacterium]|nr:2-succinyl-5-enolpyruvyl-6-hydroxy-3-cyclohexene-1-carboxylic-acid synthase [Balneolales bacterium]
MPDTPASSHNNRSQGAKNVLFCLRLLHTLTSLGVAHLVISPGSRSTPLVMAASVLAGKNKAKTYIHPDERSAAFFALGIGKSTGIPAVLICTSGTAAANYYPAVIEAKKTSTPLIVISADRPQAVRHRMAPQTIDQSFLFGKYPLVYRESESLIDAVYDDSVADFLSADGETAKLSAELFRVSTQQAGPVHLNAGFSKPLEPSPDEFDALQEEISFILKSSVMGAMPGFKRLPKISLDLHKALSQIEHHLEKSAKPVLIIGPLNILSAPERSLEAAIRKTGIPILAESTASILPNNKNAITKEGFEFPHLEAYEQFLRQPEILEQLKPDLIIRLGFPPVSRALNDYIKSNSDVFQIALASTSEVPDPDTTADEIILLPPCSSDEAETALQAEPLSLSINKKNWVDWSGIWKEISKVYSHIRESLMENATKTDAEKKLTDGLAIRSLIKLISADSETGSPQCALFISNSFSVRDLDLFRNNTLPFSHVFHNRGASGIDGVTSTALGCTTGINGELWLMIGDISFLHDTNALLQIATLTNARLRVVLLNNSGGTIFRMLPVYNHQQIYTKYFETPQQVDFGTLCRAYGIEYRKAKTSKELTKHFEEKYDGPVIIEAITDPDSSMTERRLLWNTAP